MCILLYIDLKEAIAHSISPQPITYDVDSVVDAKTWMFEQTLPLHDHLKAHQFKFERSKQGDTRMYYKEWSNDSFWLPDTGLCVLPESNPIPLVDPKELQPFLDGDILSKIETTIKKIGGYLEKGGAASWWTEWFRSARIHTSHTEPQELNGKLCVVHVCTN